MLRSLLASLALLLFPAAMSAQSVPAFDRLRFPLPDRDPVLDAMWDRIDSLLEVDLPESARKVVDSLWTVARDRNAWPHVVRATLYRGVFALRDSEDDDDGADDLFDIIARDVGSLPPVPRSVLNSIRAELIWTYWSERRWRTRNQTEIESDTSTQLSTWSPRRLVDSAESWFLASLGPESELASTPIRSWETLLETEEGSDSRRPTLFDLIAHRAIGFFTDGRSGLPRPERTWQPQGAELLLPTEEFANLGFAPSDTAEQGVRAARIFQSLIRRHRKSSAPLIDVELSRLRWGRALTNLEPKDSIYQAALATLITEHGRDTAIGEAYVNLAESLEGNQKLAEAMDVCERGTRLFPNTVAGRNCSAIAARIRSRSLDVQVESSIPPDAQFIANVSYRNLERGWFRIVRSVKSEDPELGQLDFDSTWVADLLRRPNLAAWDATFASPTPQDYRSHKVDVAIPALPIGRYFLMASATESFSIDSNLIACIPISVTRLGIVASNGETGFEGGYVRDLVSGSPIKGASVEFLGFDYNSQSQRRETITLAKTTTDATGRFAPPATRPNQYARALKVTRGADVVVKSANLHRYESESPANNDDAIIFTDRSLYRPGQSIYFKAIYIREESAKPDFHVLPGRRLTVELIDVNEDVVESQTLMTNDFGSINGVLTAPSVGLTGTMTIRIGDSRRNIRVEEYKRPKFEVGIDPIAGVHALNDTVVVTGRAIAYAGSSVDNATVTFAIRRNARFPFWGRWYDPIPSSPAAYLENGTVRTSGDGSFTIRFVARPDASIARGSIPLFTFTVEARVTDINGETQDARTSITLGYVSTSLELTVPEIMEIGGSQVARIVTTNLAGRPIPFTVGIRVERLMPPSRLTRTRILDSPDRFSMDEPLFARLFPLDARSVDSSDLRFWRMERVVIDQRLSTDSSGMDSIGLQGLPEGAYRITVAGLDRSGDSIVASRTVTVHQRGRLPYPTRFILIPGRLSLQPGDTMRLQVGSSLPKCYVRYRIAHQSSVAVDSEIEVGGGMKEIRIPITERFRGGGVIDLFAINDNRLTTHRVIVDVPWTNKELRVETRTFRNRLTPGSDETWSFTIRGPGKERVAAEVLATMYDASLDAIMPNYFPTFSWPSSAMGQWRDGRNVGTTTGSINWSRNWNAFESVPGHGYDAFAIMHRRLEGPGGGANGNRYEYSQSDGYDMESMDGNLRAMKASPPPPPPPSAASGGASADSSNAARYDDSDHNRELIAQPIRRNLVETAFFYPALRTDDSGNIVFTFTVPEALTRWRMNMFAHTIDMKVGSSQATTVTQKELMVLPNIPRFMREGDTVVLSSRISNLADRDLSGSVTLSIVDAVSNRSVDQAFGLTQPVVPFTASRKGSTSASWRIIVPPGSGVVLYRIVAKAGAFSDGEEGPIPIIPNRMLVTETLQLNIRGGTTRTAELPKLLRSGTETTARSVRLTLSMTSNPAWFAVQALPYLMEFPYECAEQTFNRYYANTLASEIVSNAPRIRNVFESWRGTDALESALQKNTELKGLLIQETPWVLAGANETERKKRLSVLFDLNRMRSEIAGALGRLAGVQRNDGSFGWFPDMPGDRYMTAYIVAGFRRIASRRGAGLSDPEMSIVARAAHWLEAEIAADYERMKNTKDVDMSADHLGYLEIQYLYALTVPNADDNAEPSEAHDFWLSQARRYWTGRPLMTQAMIAIALYREGDTITANAIIRSFRERATRSDELGMYWRGNGGWFWYDAPIETHATLMEAFSLIAGDQKELEEMKIWLLKQKQVQDWGTTRATADACHALLMTGTNLLESNEGVQVTIGGITIDPMSNPDLRIEAGTGSYSVAWTGGEIKPEMGRVTLRKDDPGIAWGALYWQYFEQLDRITPASSPLSIEKRLFRKVNSSRGPVLIEVTDTTVVHVGDAVVSRIVLHADREMEYIHLKDMRGTGFEPVNQLSRNRWQNGLGYYEAPRDASTNFFISWLPAGTWVLEYETRATIAGTFSNGISTVQSMYAPEFAAHTAGRTVTVAGDN